MSYDEHGRWDYEAAAAGKMLRGSGEAAAAGRAARMVGLGLLGVLAVALVIALGIGGDYLRGRVIGAGVRDALEAR